MRRTCPLCENPLNMADFVKSATSGLIVCPSCQRPISGALLSQGWFQALQLILITLFLTGWLVVIMFDASPSMHLDYLVIGAPVVLSVLIWSLFKKTPLLKNPPSIVSIKNNNLIIDLRYCRIHGMKPTDSILSAADGAFSIPVAHIKSLRINKGYFVVYREPDGDAIDMFFLPVLEESLISTLRGSGLESRLTVGPLP